jgi:hypothetical protein
MLHRLLRGHDARADHRAVRRADAVGLRQPGRGGQPRGGRAPAPDSHLHRGPGASLGIFAHILSDALGPAAARVLHLLTRRVLL